MNRRIKFVIDKQYERASFCLDKVASRISFYIDRFKVTYGIRLRSMVDTLASFTVNFGFGVKLVGESLRSDVTRFCAKFSIAFREICNDASKANVSVKIGTLINTIANHKSSIKVRCVKPRTLGEMSVMTLGDMSTMTLEELIAIDVV